MKRRTWGRVLAIDPTHRGFGFAILEDTGRFVDWGVKDMSGRKPDAWLRAVHDLVEWYLPDAIAVEDCKARESRRGRHARAFIAKLLALAKELKLWGCRVRPRDVRLSCAGSKDATKEQVATALTGRFPELMPRLPPKRKLSMSEDYRMAIFDALGMAVTVHRSLRIADTPPSVWRDLVRLHLLEPMNQSRETEPPGAGDSDAINTLRQKAARLFSEGKLSEAEIGRSLRVGEPIVRGWYWKWRMEGGRPGTAAASPG